MISIGFVVAVIVGPILAIGLLSAAIALYRKGKADDDRFLFWGTGGFALAGALVTTIGFAQGLYPYDMQYHRYQHVQGTVTAIHGRLLGNDKSTTENFAVQLNHHDTYRCDDTRCSLLKDGDQVALWCIRDWQYASTPGWDCNYDSSKSPQ